MAIAPQVGIVYYELQRATCNAERFGIYLDNLSIVLDDEPAFIIMDNAPAHSRAEMMNPEIHTIQKLPPYSPFLNPIEEVFSIVKAAIKAKLNDANIQRQLLNDRGHIDQQVNLHEYRLGILRGVAEDILDDREIVSVAKCVNINTRMMGYLPRCMDLVDIFH